jgi:hypothetical protein
LQDKIQLFERKLKIYKESIDYHAALRSNSGFTRNEYNEQAYQPDKALKGDSKMQSGKETSFRTRSEKKSGLRSLR